MAEIDPARVEATLGGLDDLARRTLALPRPGTPVAYYASLHLHAQLELSDGVRAELGAGRRHNSERLARHLWEYEIELAWLLDEPDTRMPKIMAREAQHQTRLIRQMSEAELAAFGPPELRDMFERHYEQAKADGNLPPNLSGMAEEINRGSHYKRNYRLLSGLSHPGISGTGGYVQVTGEDIAQALVAPPALADIELGRVPVTHRDASIVLFGTSMSLCSSLEAASAILPVDMTDLKKLGASIDAITEELAPEATG